MVCLLTGVGANSNLLLIVGNFSGCRLKGVLTSEKTVFCEGSKRQSIFRGSSVVCLPSFALKALVVFVLFLVVSVEYSELYCIRSVMSSAVFLQVVPHVITNNHWQTST